MFVTKALWNVATSRNNLVPKIAKKKRKERIFFINFRGKDQMQKTWEIKIMKELWLQAMLYMYMSGPPK